MDPKSYLRTERALHKLKVFVIIFLHMLSTEREYRLGILSITLAIFSRYFYYNTTRTFLLKLRPIFSSCKTILTRGATKVSFFLVCGISACQPCLTGNLTWWQYLN